MIYKIYLKYLEFQYNKQFLLYNRYLMEFMNLRKMVFLIKYNYFFHTAVIHRDIKSANIFLKQGIPKLADFGFAICKNISFSDELTYYNVGTPIYMPPETLMQNKYSMKSDIWATGIVLYELLFSNIDKFIRFVSFHIK